MPPFHANYNPDDIKNQILDRRLILRLVRYLKPYWIYIMLAFVLIILVSGMELYLPYLIKETVDKYIESDKNALILKGEKAIAFQQNYPNVKAELFEYDGNSIFLFSGNDKYKIDSKQKKAWEKSNQLLSQNVLILPRNKDTKPIYESIETIAISEDNFIVGQRDYRKVMKTLSKEKQKIIRKDALKGLQKMGLIYVLVSLFRLFVFYAQIYVITYAAQHAMYDLRNDLLSHLQRMPASFFDKNPVGRLVTRITNDVRTLDEMLGAGLITMIQDIFVVIGIMGMMLFMSWRLAIASFITLPFVLLLMTIFRRKSRAIYRKVRKKLAELNTKLSEDMSGMKIIQLFHQQKNKINMFREINEEYYRATLSQMYVFATFRPLINIARPIAIAIVVWYGGGQILNNYLSLGIFLAFLRYLERFFRPINNISEKFNVLQAAMSGAERIFDLMEEKTEDYRTKKENNAKFSGKIDIQDMWLAYNEGEYVLKNINLNIKPGEKVALVGHTGSGKTSIVNLLLGMYPFQKGSISFDDQNILSYGLNDIRRNIGMVQQDVFLFSGNVRDNITLNLDLTDEQVQQAAEKVSIHKFIDHLPGKYLEPVMERGATLSVGQRQLIAFARVLAYNPSIFILDEATSNIDTETEQIIQEALFKVMENRTSIIIAHRLSTIQHVDKIVVLHKGEIVEVGSHQELLSNEGLYYDLYRLQYASQANA